MPPHPDLRLGDCLDILPTLAAASVDAVVTDPPYGLEFMGRDWDGQVPGVLYWAQCLRVLRPGGHLLAFGGTRTWHRLAVAIEDAGFEIRDTITWLYGSGFPKSLDVSKAIDKAGGDPLAFRRFAEAYAAAVEASLLNHADIDRRLGIKSSSCYWARDDHRGGLPPRHHWEQVCDLLCLDVALGVLYDAAEREITQEATRPFVPGEVISFDQRSSTERERRDIPATPDAARWQGWGTALKPASEPIIVARKPLSGTVAANVQAHGTGALNIAATRVCASGSSAELRTVPTSQGAAGSSPCGSTADTDTWRAAARTIRNYYTQLPASSDVELAARNAPLASALARALDPALAPGSPAGYPSCRGCDGGRVRLGEEAARGAAPSTSGARGSLDLRWTASRIRAYRCADHPSSWDELARLVEAGSVVAAAQRPPDNAITNVQGRWPANVVLSHADTCADECAPGCPVAELDAQSGTSKSPGTYARSTVVENHVYGASNERPMQYGHGDEGGASRFFPTFKYQAKAPTRERPKIDGKGWPTVKPLGLMRWLVRLVTPPGGLVLDPFAGTGATLQAARDEGFRALGIERDPFAYQLACQRLAVPVDHEPDQDVDGLCLFDLDGQAS